MRTNFQVISNYYEIRVDEKREEIKKYEKPKQLCNQRTILRLYIIAGFSSMRRTCARLLARELTTFHTRLHR